MKAMVVATHCGLLLSAVALQGCQGDAQTQVVIRALESGDTPTADAIINDKTFDVNAANNNGVTPLLQALTSGNREMFGKLLKRGADPNLCDTEGRCVMNQAATKSDSYWIREALAHGGDPNALNTGNRHSPNSTPLFYAIQKELPGVKSRIENVRLLIQADADVNHRNANGIVPLRAAAGAGYYDIAIELLDAGADPLQGDKHGLTLVDWFDGRDESLVPDDDQVQWFNKAADILIERGLLERDGDGNLKKKGS